MNYQDLQTRLYKSNGLFDPTKTREQNLEAFKKNGPIRTLKDEYRAWFQTGDLNLDVGLTLMPKKPMHKDALRQAGCRYFEVLNRLTYKNAYKKYGKKLRVVMTIEGELSKKMLHIHAAMDKPETMTLLEFSRGVTLALHMTKEFQMKNHYDITPADPYWLGYITKELDAKQLANLFFV